MSVRLSHQLTAAAAVGRFATEVGHMPAADIDDMWLRKFCSDYNEVQHTCFDRFSEKFRGIVVISSMAFVCDVFCQQMAKTKKKRRNQSQ